MIKNARSSYTTRTVLKLQTVGIYVTKRINVEYYIPSTGTRGCGSVKSGIGEILRHHFTVIPAADAIRLTALYSKMKSKKEGVPPPKAERELSKARIALDKARMRSRRNRLAEKNWEKRVKRYERRLKVLSNKK